MPERMARNLDRIVAALLPVGLVTLTLHCIVAHDVWWQLATGEWVLANGFPTTDPFSYAFPDREWIEMRWLYCVAIHLLHRAFGLNALILAKTGILAVTFGLIGWLVPRRRGWAASFGVTCALAVAHPRFQVRPELVTYLLLAVTLTCLVRYRAGGDRRWLYALPPVQILWTNAHTLFALGPVVLWLFVAAEWAAGRRFARRLGNDLTRLSSAQLREVVSAAVAVTLACLVNPYFLRGALFPLRLFGQIRSGNVLDPLIDEFRTPFEGSGSPFFLASYLVVAAVSGASFWINRRRAVPSSLAVWGAFLYLSVLAQRNVALFALVAGICTIQNLDQSAASDVRLDRIGGWAARLSSLAFLAIMIPAVASDAYYRRTDTAKRFGLGVAEHRFPIRALAFARREGLPRPVLSSLGDGGYVLFDGGPKSVYVDGRLEVFGGEIIKTAVETLNTGENFDATVARMGLATVLLRHNREVGLLQLLEQRPDWAPVYFDEGHVVYVRLTPETRAAVERLRVDWRRPIAPAVEVRADLTPADWLAGLWPKVEVVRGSVALGQLFVTVGNLALAERQLEDAVRRDPGEATARLYLGLLYRATGREVEAAPLLAGLGRQRLERDDIGRLALSICVRAARDALTAGRFDAARAALLEIARLTPADPVAWNNLGALAIQSGVRADALRYFETSLSLDPRQAPVLNQMGGLALHRGDLAGARHAFERALAVDPSYQPARENLARLGP